MAEDRMAPLGVSERHVRTRIAPNGEIKIEAFGFEGQTCLAATQDLEVYCGPQKAREMKPPERESFQGTN